MKSKIWFLFLCGISLTLAWCFHIPDEDWIFTKNSPVEEKKLTHEESEFIDSMNVLLDEFQKDNSNENNNEPSERENEIEIQIQNSGSDLNEIDILDTTWEIYESNLIE